MPARHDLYRKYDNIYDLVLYSPRAMQIGFLSPFPSDWNKYSKISNRYKGTTVGAIGYFLASIETIIWYMFLLGFIYIMYKNPYVVKPLTYVFCFSIVIITLLGYVVPNVGAIYRMRQAYMIPFYIYGAYGLILMVSNFTKK